MVLLSLTVIQGYSRREVKRNIAGLNIKVRGFYIVGTLSIYETEIRTMKAAFSSIWPHISWVKNYLSYWLNMQTLGPHPTSWLRTSAGRAQEATNLSSSLRGFLRFWVWKNSILHALEERRGQRWISWHSQGSYGKVYPYPSSHLIKKLSVVQQRKVSGFADEENEGQLIKWVLSQMWKWRKEKHPDKHR